MRLSLVLAGALLVGTLLVGGATASPSPVRVLVAKVTWGPQPFTDAEVEAEVAPIPAFYATASFGQVSLAFSETPWLTLLSGPTVCKDAFNAYPFTQSVRDLLANAGYPATSYDRLVVLIPQENDCGFTGITQPSAIVVNGRNMASIVAHELGHTFGMGHAGTLDCHFSRAGRRFCRLNLYGDPWDVMGGLDVSVDLGDFGALQKIRAGWISSYTPVAKAGVYQIAALEQTSTLPQALLIRAGEYEYWVDHREPLGNDAYLAGDPGHGPVVTGFEVHRLTGDAVAAPGGTELGPDYLIPTGPANALYTPVGSTFAIPGVCSLAALSRANGVMSVRFRWLDHAKPTAPKNVNVRGSVVSFKASADGGSGVDHYVVSVDGHESATVPARPLPPAISTAGKLSATLTATLPQLAPGRHTVGVVAVDRAGNRGRAATVVVRA